MAFLKDTKIDGNLYVELDIRASEALSYVSTGGGDESTAGGFGFPRFENALIDNIAKFSEIEGTHNGLFKSSYLNEEKSNYIEDPEKFQVINISFENELTASDPKDVIITNATNILFRDGEINIVKAYADNSEIHLFYKVNGNIVEHPLANIGSTDASKGKVPGPNQMYGFYFEKPASI